MEKKRRWADSRRIYALDPTELYYWSKFLGVEEQGLRVARAGRKIGRDFQRSACSRAGLVDAWRRGAAVCGEDLAGLVQLPDRTLTAREPYGTHHAIDI